MFDDKCKGVFESYLNVINAAFQWSDEDWHNNFEEKIIVGIREGTITKEDVPQIQKDLDAYIIKIRKDRDVYVKEMEIEKKKKEEQERLQREELEKMRQEETERKQRKAKQLPEVVELMDEYNFSQTNLKKEKSKENYLAVFHACYSIIANWGIVGCLDEFAGVYKCFKEAVFDYLSTARTVESLYSVVFYYTDRRILESYNDRKARKQHLQEGLKYVKAFNETVDDEKSALIYIDCYLQMTQCCRTGEDLEELSYADKAYKLAKKFALKYKSEIMLEELDLAKLTLKVYYQTHNQETEAERVEKEFEKIKEQM